MKEFVGQNFRGMMVSLKAKYKYEMDDAELEKFVLSEEDRVIANLKAKLRPCEGADAELEKLQAEGKYHLSVVSSSAGRRLTASLDKVNQHRFFDAKDVFSAATSLPKPTSKPDPAVYNYALEKLGAKAEEAVAVEDSKSGSTAAFRANIKCIGYVGSYPAEEQDEMAEKLKGCGCAPIMRHWSEFPECLRKIEAGEV